MGPRATAFYGAVARGGAGLIITETPAMEFPLLEDGDRRFRIDDDKYLSSSRRFAKEIHKFDTPLFSQLYHRGPWAGVYALAAQPCASSALTYPSPFDVHDAKPPHALTVEEIEFLVDLASLRGRPGYKKRAGTASRSTPGAIICFIRSCRVSGTSGPINMAVRTWRTARVFLWT